MTLLRNVMGQSKVVSDRNKGKARPLVLERRMPQGIDERRIKAEAFGKKAHSE